MTKMSRGVVSKCMTRTLINIKSTPASGTQNEYAVLVCGYDPNTEKSCEAEKSNKQASFGSFSLHRRCILVRNPAGRWLLTGRERARSDARGRNEKKLQLVALRYSTPRSCFN